MDKQDHAVADFSEVRAALMAARRRHPGHLKDIQRIERTVEGLISEYGSVMVLYRQSHRRKLLERSYAILEKISHCVDRLNRAELFVLLSRS